MEVQPAVKTVRAFVFVFGVLSITITLGRLAVLVPDWLVGVPPAYPDQYARRLLSALTTVPLVSAVLLLHLGRNGAPTRGRLMLVGALLTLGIAAMVLDVIRG